MAYSGRRPVGLLIESENSDIFQVIEEIDTVRLIPILLTLFLTGPVMADDWKEYENQDYSFTIHFPVDPTVETAAYQATDGRSLAFCSSGVALSRSICRMRSARYSSCPIFHTSA
jgi:hypothetical protein